MVQAGNPGKSRDVCDHPALFLTNNHAILKCLLASYSTVNIHKVQSEVLKTEGEVRGFQHSGGTLRMLMNDKSCLIAIIA